MIKTFWKATLGVLVSFGVCSLLTAAEPKADVEGFRRIVAPFLEKYCLECHSPENARGQFTLHDIDANLLSGSDRERWRFVEEQLRFDLMPPKKRERPPVKEREAVRNWIRTELLKTQQPDTITEARLLLPQFGNLVDHDALFHRPAGPVVPPAPRLWRVRPEIYKQFADRFVKNGPKKTGGVSQPFSILPGDGFKDYAAPYFIDEPTTDLLFRNAEMIVDGQTLGKMGTIPELKRLLDPKVKVNRAQIEAALRTEFQLALRRLPTPEELRRLLDLYDRNVATSGSALGGRETLIAILMHPEAVFRLELGEGPVDALGRRKLSPRETAIALSFALRNAPEEELLAAAAAGKLQTPEQIAGQVKRLLEGGTDANPRLLQFFREYFGYLHSVDVFKDDPKGRVHVPAVLVNDLELLILDIVRSDREVLRELLTTRKVYAGKETLAAKDYPFRVDFRKITGVAAPLTADFAGIYGLPIDWKRNSPQPVELSGEDRVGVLCHPAWLTAWSGNFDNHPVQRGKWIRTHLLGGHVPDVPIGVDARVPEDPHSTLRERLAGVTRKAECWRCHRKMDDLGLPFERYDHYGWYRDREVGKPVDASGLVAFTGNPELESPVTHPVELVQRLAKSELVEQVFVRHAFRFFLGRNETLGDAATLQKAHKAYRASGGSFKALVASLLGSESFLYRREVPAK